MRFNVAAIATVGLAATAMAKPIQKRSIVSELAVTIDDVYSTVSAELSSANTLLGKAVNLLDTIVGQLVSDLEAATSAVVTGTDSIVSELASGVETITADEIAQLEENLQTVDDIINATISTLDTISADLIKGLITAVTSEAEALKAALQPFVEPIVTFAQGIVCADCVASDITAVEDLVNTILIDLDTLVGIPLKGKKL